MKTLSILAAGALLLASCQNQPAPQEQQASSSNKSFYGEPFEPTTILKETELPQALAGKTEAEVVFESKIIETCAKAGCWMTVESTSGYPMYVYMKDHGFAVPLNGAANLRCVVKGLAYHDTLSVEHLKHLAEDANKSQAEIDAITSPLPVLAVDATGVMIEGYTPAEAPGTHPEEEGHDHEGHDHQHHEGDGHDHGH